MSKDYFYFHWKKDEGGIACSPKDNDIEFIEQLESYDKVPFVLIMEDGQFQDYLANDLGWPIFSEKFKRILEPFLTSNNVRWIPARIEDVNGEQYTAYILKFNEKVDVLDKEKTIFAGDDFIVKAVLSKEKIKNKDIFIIPDSDFQIVISENVKLKIEYNNVTGIDFSKVPVG